MTSQEIIAASYAAERNYSHNPDDVIDASNAVGAWGTAKESTTELADLSGTGNTGTIHGPMPAEGFIQGRRFTAANENSLDCGNDSTLNLTGAFTIVMIINTLDASAGAITSKGNYDGDNEFQFYILESVLKCAGHGEFTLLTTTQNVWDGKYHCLMLQKDDNDDGVMSIDGIEVKRSIGWWSGQTISNGNHFMIGSTSPPEGRFYFNGSSVYIYLVNSALSETEKIQNFNTLARLPFWSVNYTDYPNNVAEYTDNLPYSSSIISSGTFKVDNDKLQCVSAGTMTYSASYAFDGSEYIKVEIDGVEYAGTGTITQGNTTVSVAQGSNKITIQSGTGDTIDKVDIQFRKEV